MKRCWMFGFFIVLAIAFSFLYDYQISIWIISLRNVFFNQFLLGLNFISNVVILFFFLTSLFLWQEHKRRWILPLWLSLFFSSILSYSIKFIVGRARPFISFEEISVLAAAASEYYSTWSTSFPSAHTMIAFSALPILSKEFPKFRYIWILFAGLVAFSRVYFGVHYMSDVLVGAVLGYLLGFIFIKLEKRYSYGEKLVKSLKK